MPNLEVEEIYGDSDDRMDQRGKFEMPLNALPIKCSLCTFPDLDFISQPYLLGKGINKPIEIETAEVGNFLIRERARRVIEVVCPNQCDFYPTTDMSGQPTPWTLAVPKHLVKIGAVVKAKIPRCPECGEPKTAHGSQFDSGNVFNSMQFDIAKSVEWGSNESTGEKAGWYYMHVLKLPRPPEVPEGHWTRLQLNRCLFFSSRFELLLKTLKIKGVTPVGGSRKKPSESDQVWVREQTKLLTDMGVLAAAPVAQNTQASSVYKAFCTKHARKQSLSVDFSNVESKIKKEFPESYKEYISGVRKVKFSDVDDKEGFVVTILNPAKMNLVDYRCGTLAVEDDESAEVDGVAFATTGHGDVFCFDISADGTDYPVYLYEHELNCFTPYATNFSECILRFVGK